jgi:hypothetical protein
MPLIPQFPYLSPEARRLRERDATPPWGVHPCEVDAFAWLTENDGTAFYAALTAARRLRAEIEAVPGDDRDDAQEAR